MEKETFIAEKAKIEAEIYKLNKAITELKEEYKRSNALFAIGERVKVVTPPYEIWSMFSGKVKMTEHEEEFAYVSEYKITYGNNVEPILKKEKKDGTMSMITLYCNYNLSKIVKL